VIVAKHIAVGRYRLSLLRSCGPEKEPNGAATRRAARRGRRCYPGRLTDAETAAIRL